MSDTEKPLEVQLAEYALNLELIIGIHLPERAKHVSQEEMTMFLVCRRIIKLWKESLS